MNAKRWILFALPAMMVACANTDATAPDNPRVTSGAATLVGPMATSPDPCPTCTGIYLTRSAADWSQCYGNASPDEDRDQLNDNCEYLVAAAFAPMLNMSPQDGCKTHEPYFAARPDYGVQMEIFYLLGYHWDCGSLGHPGDSEWIALHVAHNGESGRWELVDMTTSAHWHTDNEQTGTYSYDQVWYPAQDFTSRNFGQSRKYPEVWVSRNKHANYRDKSECRNFFSGDTCVDNVPYYRVNVSPYNNLGSYAYMLKDCVNSTLGGVGIECFWTGSLFRGWQNAGGDTSYREILAHYGWLTGEPM